MTGNLHKLGERRETDKRRGEEDAGEEEIGSFTKVGEERVKETREDSVDKKIDVKIAKLETRIEEKTNRYIRMRFLK